MPGLNTVATMEIVYFYENTLSSTYFNKTTKQLLVGLTIGKIHKLKRKDKSPLLITTVISGTYILYTFIPCSHIIFPKLNYMTVIH